VDEINGYRCSCPPGRSGLRCQEGRWGMPLARPRSGWGVRGSLLSMCPTSPAHSDRVWEVLLVAGHALPSRELVGGGLQQLPLPGRPPRLQQGVGSVHPPCALPLPCGSAASAPQACSPHHSPPTLLLTRGGCGGRETGEPGPGRRGPPCCAGLLHRGALAVGALCSRTHDQRCVSSHMVPSGSACGSRPCAPRCGAARSPACWLAGRMP